MLCIHYCLLVVFLGLALLKGDCAGGAYGQAVAEPVAVIVAHEFGLAVNELYRTLVAGAYA
jgi:hypothetical protein